VINSLVAMAKRGTCSRLAPDEEMIYTADGFMPDIVVNPNCLVSRMTVAQQVESLLGKASAVSGRISPMAPRSQRRIWQRPSGY